MKIALIAFSIGLTSGAVAALCGVGGGLIMVPAFVALLGLPQKVAVATSMAIIVPTAVSATIVNWRSGIIDKQILLWTALGAVLTAVFFTTKLKSMNDATLTKLFAVFAIAMGIKLWFTETPEQKAVAPETPQVTTAASTSDPPDPRSPGDP